MKRAWPLALWVFVGCTPTPADVEQPSVHQRADDNEAQPDAGPAPADALEKADESAMALDVEVRGIGTCTEASDCQWIESPYRSAEELRDDASGCCAMACQRPNVVVSTALLEASRQAAQTVCADHRSGKAQCPPPAPCRSTDPWPYVIEPRCEAGQCGGVAVPLGSPSE